jgi:nicotinate-nucleotide--dimethylbenzimidazole phosphoribosyltransferase
MTREQAIRALETGIEIVNDRVKLGYNCFSLGEMGIGNTSSSAAIVAAFTQLAPEVVTGRGTGISDTRMQVKINIVRQGLAVNQPNPSDGIDVLAKVGGFELGALAGVVLGAAANRCAVVIDGLNTTAATLIAAAIQPVCKQYLFASHLSAEPAHRFALKLLDLKPCVDMGVRLGEAIGASIVVDMLAAIANAIEKPIGISFYPAGDAGVESLKAGERLLAELVSQIKPLHTVAMEACQLRMDNLTKPLASLYGFEQLARQLAGITGNPRPRTLKKQILVVTGDQGANQEMPINDAQGLASRKYLAVSGFANHACANVVVYNAAEGARINLSAQELTSEQTIQMIKAGAAVARKAIKSGVQVLGLGVRGGDNRQAAVAFVQQLANCHSTNEVINSLNQSGSVVIAGLAGAILGAAAGGAAVVLDDVETTAAACAAAKLAPQIRDYLIASHTGTEAQQTALERLGIKAHLHLELMLGDGTGAALGMRLLDASLHMLNDMKTFGEAEVAVAQDGPGALRQNKTVKD